MHDKQIKTLMYELDLSEDEAIKLLADSQEFYNIIESYKASKCPMSMSLAMAIQVNHMWSVDEYGLQSFINDIGMCGHGNVVDAIANANKS